MSNVWKSESGHRPRVVILQHRLLHYRTGFFERLRDRCEASGIELELVVGQASPREAVKKDEGRLHWALEVKNRFLSLPNRDLVWQSLPRTVGAADVVVLMQESRILSNYALLLRRYFTGRPRLAYWGHGRNFQSETPHGWRERWKKVTLTKVDWWFAYTEVSRQLVLAAGFPSDRITRLDNAVDSERFRADLSTISEADIQNARVELGISPTDRVLLFCGSLYPDKRMDLLVQATEHIRLSRQDVQLVVVGDGPSMEDLQVAAKSRPWLKILGARRGKEKALYYRLADINLNPGALGLHIVDAFCAGLVMLSTKSARHGPEIAYVRNGVNGLLVDDTPAEIGEAVLQLLNSPVRLSQMRAAALADAEVYTLDNMVERFVQGLVGVIKLGPT